MMPILPNRQHSGGIHHNINHQGPNRYRLIGGTLVIHAVVAEDQGRYVCTVNNSAGSIEARSELMFREKLHVRIVEPSPGASASSVLLADAETPVTITCAFSGSPR